MKNEITEIHILFSRNRKPLNFNDIWHGNEQTGTPQPFAIERKHQLLPQLPNSMRFWFSIKVNRKIGIESHFCSYCHQQFDWENQFLQSFWLWPLLFRSLSISGYVLCMDFFLRTEFSSLVFMNFIFRYAFECNLSFYCRLAFLPQPEKIFTDFSKCEKVVLRFVFFLLCDSIAKKSILL